ncbi:MAG: hypothetical protein JWO94_672 [Verrucomicrobiaceae bacterium]|nr:hypothetical protein [Verrucomicrobiaceae bacterium]
MKHLLIFLALAVGTFAQQPAAQPATPPPDQSWVDFVSERGPTITADLTSALGTVLPDYKSLIPAIREGLRDEGAEKPVTAQACAAAEKLCNVWLMTLAERDSRFASVGQTAPPSTDFKSSKKQNLQPWDLFMYLREQDDARKKKEDDKQMQNYFGDAQKKNWADRGAVLHTGLDNLYSKFRLARRQALQASAAKK